MSPPSLFRLNCRRCLLVESFGYTAHAGFAIELQQEPQVAPRQCRHRTKAVANERIAMAVLEVANYDDVALELRGRDALRLFPRRQEGDEISSRCRPTGWASRPVESHSRSRFSRPRRFGVSLAAMDDRMHVSANFQRGRSSVKNSCRLSRTDSVGTWRGLGSPILARG